MKDRPSPSRSEDRSIHRSRRRRRDRARFLLGAAMALGLTAVWGLAARLVHVVEKPNPAPNANSKKRARTVLQQRLRMGLPGALFARSASGVPRPSSPASPAGSPASKKPVRRTLVYLLSAEAEAPAKDRPRLLIASERPALPTLHPRDDHAALGAAARLPWTAPPPLPRERPRAGLRAPGAWRLSSAPRAPPSRIV